MIIQNFDEVAINNRRKRLLNSLSETFDELSPEDIVHRSAEAIKDKISMHPRVFAIGFGKASYLMYKGIREFLLPNLKYAGIIVPDDFEVPETFPEAEILRGSHPTVSNKSVESSRRLLSGLGRLEGDDLVIVLMSGGGSALFEVPEDDVLAEDIARISTCMMRNDADIFELNTIRTGLSKVKGGKLARILYPAKVISFVVSDVVGDDLRTISSGPLSVRDNFIMDFKKVFEKYSRKCDLESVEDLMLFPPRGEEYFERVKNNIILTNEDFISLLTNKLRASGDNVVYLASNFCGEVEEVAKSLTTIVRSISNIKKGPFWFVAGGETTVKVTGSGAGGRNQELCLRFMNEMADDEEFLFMSVGTDGIDGESIAMGGIVDTDTKGLVKDLDIQEFLKNNDSYNALKKCNGAIISGRTGNNVSDVIVGHYSG